MSRRIPRRFLMLEKTWATWRLMDQFISNKSTYTYSRLHLSQLSSIVVFEMPQGLYETYDIILTRRTRFNEAKPLSRYKRKSSDDDDDTPIISKRIKKIDDNGARMEEFPFYGEAEWPLV
jgi:hypothetical protein